MILSGAERSSEGERISKQKTLLLNFIDIYWVLTVDNKSILPFAAEANKAASKRRSLSNLSLNTRNEFSFRKESEKYVF